MCRAENQRVVVIVDPFCTARLIVEECLRRYPVVCVISSAKLPSRLLDQVDREPFLRYIEHIDITTTLGTLDLFDVKGVVAGWDTGCRLAEELLCVLGLPGHDPSLRRCRTNKYHMQKRLAHMGLQSISQLRAASEDECVTWACSWPVVVKPTSSKPTSRRNTCVCWDESSVRKAFRGFSNAKRRTRMLCQQYLHGTEYAANCITVDGSHMLLSLWEKREDSQVSLLLPSRGALQDTVRLYLSSALDALGVQNGPSRSRIIVVDGSPYLVDVKWRLPGFVTPALTLAATGFGEHELVADLLCAGDLFERMGGTNYRYICKKFALERHIDGTHVVPNRRSVVEVLVLPGDGTKGATSVIGVVHARSDCLEEQLEYVLVPVKT